MDFELDTVRRMKSTCDGDVEKKRGAKREERKREQKGVFSVSLGTDLWLLELVVAGCGQLCLVLSLSNH